MSIYVKQAGTWYEIPPPPVVKPELPGLGGWADISDTPTSTYTDTAGAKWNVWTFTAVGSHSLTITKEGLIDILICSGGGGATASDAGQGGRVMDGVRPVPGGALPIVVGHTGTGQVNGMSGASSIGSVVAGPVSFGWGGAINMDEGYTSMITGTPLVVGSRFFADPAKRAVYGLGATPSTSATAGVVIVRRPA